MAYFPHAYQKVLIATNGFYKAGTVQDSATKLTEKGSIDLTAGVVGVFDAKSNKSILPAAAGLPTKLNSGMVYLAQGSFHTVDKIGPFHGGYKESIKTKGINPKYVSRFYKVNPDSAQNQIIKLGCDSAVTFYCNQTYRLRLDIKGSPALRFLTHNVYKTLDGYTGCCTGTSTTELVDPTVVFLTWKDQIAADPILSQFVSPKVWSSAASTTGTWSNAGTTITVASATGIAVGQKVTGTGLAEHTYVTAVSGTTITINKAATAAGSTAAVVFWKEVLTSTYVPVTVQGNIPNVRTHIDLAGAYQDTQFGDCSFHPMDHVELAPVLIYPSVVDSEGNPCTMQAFCVTETQAPKVTNGLGETILRDLILHKRYLQEPWQQDPRMREVLNDTSLSEISRTSLYTSYYILHNVPRNSNPSGTLDADQYLIRIVVASADADFEALFNKILELGNGNTTVALETV